MVVIPSYTQFHHKIWQWRKATWNVKSVASTFRSGHATLRGRKFVLSDGERSRTRAEGLLNMWFVYILQCKDKSYYIGSTNNIERRLKDHLRGSGGKYTISHKAERIVYKEELPNKSEALKREHQLKKWSRAKKEHLIKENLYT